MENEPRLCPRISAHRRLTAIMAANDLGPGALAASIEVYAAPECPEACPGAIKAPRSILGFQLPDILDRLDCGQQSPQ